MLGAALGLITTFIRASPAGPPPSPACRDARECNVAGTRALAAGRMPDAESAFEAEVRFAWCEGDTDQLVLAHNNLAVLALRGGEPLRARFWADVALKHDAKSAAARYNARLANERAARLPPGQGVTGTYSSSAGDSLVNEVGVQELSANRIRFELWAAGAFSCVDMGNHLGGASGQVPFDGREAVWETQEFGGRCRLRFSFGADELTVTQEGDWMDCGFGQRVSAHGTYRRTSRKAPRFTPAR